MNKIKLATIWLDGCSGCHMSLLDIDQRLIDIADKVDFLYSPLVDAKSFPEEVDIFLVEGAISTDEDIEKIKKIRKCTKILAAFGDCAVTANIPAMRNPLGAEEVMKSVYLESDAIQAQLPTVVVPKLNEKSVPLHQYVKVDLFIPGCPPSADTIFHVLSELAEGRMPDLTQLSRFGA